MTFETVTDMVMKETTSLEHEPRSTKMWGNTLPTELSWTTYMHSSYETYKVTLKNVENKIEYDTERVSTPDTFYQEVKGATFILQNRRGIGGF
jgi:hypothetical protein